MKGFLINSGLVLVSMLIGFSALEMGVRIYADVAKPYAIEPEGSDTEIRPSVYDSRGFWTWSPGYRGRFDNRVDFTDKRVTTTRYGGRGIPCAAGVRTPDSHIYLIGDSQTFGWGLSDDETWANQLQCQLNIKNPGKFKVYNLGFPGAQVDQLYARGIGQVEPVIEPGDIVVISFTWNDLVTFYKSLSFVRDVMKRSGLKQLPITDPSRVEVTTAHEPSPGAPKAERRPGLEIRLTDPVRYLNAASWRYPLYKEYGVFLPSFNSWSSFLNSMQYISAAYKIAFSHARLLYYRLRPSNELKAKIPRGTFRNNFLVLKSLETRLRYKGAKVLIQFLPNRLFFDDYYYQSYSKNGAVFPSQDYLGYVGTSFCQSLGLTCVNRFGDLATPKRDAHTFAFDGHFNQAGAARIAAALALDLDP